MTTRSSDRLRRAAAHPLAVPVLMAVLICLLGAHVASVFKIPSWGNDEAPHVGYVAALAHGNLPTIDSPIIDDWARFPPDPGLLLGWDAEHRDIWTANHPPIYHLLLVPIWWLTSDDLSHMVIAMRLVNTLGFGCWVLLVGLIARELVPRRPAVPALATVVAVTPSLAMRSGFLMNDGWGSAAALLVMLMTIRLLRAGAAGVTGQRIVVAALAGVLAAGTRAPGVLVVAICSVALLVCLGRERRGLLAAVAVGGVPAVATGWFYLRNLHLYGDLTGQGALVEKFDRAPVETLVDLAQVPGLWEALVAALIPVLVFVTVVPYVAVRRIRAGAPARVWRLDAAWTMLVVHAVLTAINIVSFMRGGGYFHDRYLMTVMPLLATVTALGMLSFRRSPDDRGDWRAATAWSAVLLVWLAGAFACLEWYFVFSRQDRSPVEGVVPVVLLAVAAAVGVLVVAVMARRGAGTVWHSEACPIRPTAPYTTSTSG